MLSRAVCGLLFSAVGIGGRLDLRAIAARGFLATDATVLCGAADTVAVAAGCAFVFDFFALAPAFFARFFFLSAADFAFSARNSDFSCFICFFSAFLRASTCLLAMLTPRRCL